MKFLITLFALFAILSFGKVYSADEGSDVVKLTPDNFDQVVDGSKYVFVEFFAPWCGHCKKLAPDYEIVATAFKNEKEVVIASVDADAHKELGSRFGVSGYPTLKFFTKGDTKDESYSGGRDPESLISWINGKAGSSARIAVPPSDVVTLDPTNFDTLAMDSTKDAFVEFYAPWCGHCKHLAPTWEKLGTAFKQDDVVIGKVDADKHRSLGQKFGVSGFPTIVALPKDNKEGERYEGGRELAELVDYVNDKFGTNRQENGRLRDTAGRVVALDELAQSFFTDKENRDSIKSQTEEAVKGLSGNEEKSGKYYLKVMSAIEKRGDDFPEKEVQRLNRMLDSGSVHSSKIDEFTERTNILSQFAAE